MVRCGPDTPACTPTRPPRPFARPPIVTATLACCDRGICTSQVAADEICLPSKENVLSPPHLSAATKGYARPASRLTRSVPRPRKTYCHHDACLPRPRNLHIHVRRRRRVLSGGAAARIIRYTKALWPDVSPIQGKRTVTTTLLCRDQGILTSGRPAVTVTMWL